MSGDPWMSMSISLCVKKKAHAWQEPLLWGDLVGSQVLCLGTPKHECL